MVSLPDAYPSPLHLPFNGESIKGRFRLESPDRDPGGEGVWLLLRNAELVVGAGGGAPRLPEGALPPLSVPGDVPPLYIGRWQGKPCRVLPLETDASLPPSLSGENLLASAPQLPIDLLSLGGTARQILHWEGNSRFCSRCCGLLVRLPGEWGKKCGGCAYAHFPHIHPCAIVLVRRGAEVLLTRKAEWPPERYSLVAGFLDFGECLEEAAAREVLEETGVEVKNVRYAGSQCWPFPSQLMAGFFADFAGGEIRVEDAELEDARWFSREALPLLPPKRSIARFLLDRYLSEG